jgi:membrane protein DedA with SNARE-associated domain
VLTEAVTNFAIKCLDLTGYAGAAGLMALESMIAPIPSEAVMPFVGFLVADGSWNLWLAVMATSLGSLTGSLLSYAMGYYGGKPLVLKVGKYLLLNPHDLEITERFFQRRGGLMTVFVSRFVPVVRHLISIPAGMGRMPLVPFAGVTLIGATLWNSFLLVCGMKLREHWRLVQQYSHQIDVVIGVLLLLGLVWFVSTRVRLNRRKAMGEAD